MLKFKYTYIFYFLVFISSIICIPRKLTIYREDDRFSFAINYNDLNKTFNNTLNVWDNSYKYFNESMTSKDLIEEMGFGWNLGNTFDAFNNSLGKEKESLNEGLSSETSWGNPETTEKMIIGLVSKGIKTIRIPVTWHNHIIDNGYTIDPEWMRRVKKVVDWCLDWGLYVILNMHHDNSFTSPISYGQGYYPLNEDKVESEKFLYNVWSQIAAAFNDGYDHHLIFEVLNEPRLAGNGKYEWFFNKNEPICQEAVSCLNEYLRIILKAIRDSGNNNTKRFILVPALSASYQSSMESDFIFPGDKIFNEYNEKILLSVHMYTPYDFVMNPNMTYIKFEKNEAYKNELYYNFKQLYENYVSRGHHVVITEMGTINKNNIDSRIQYAKYFTENAKKYQIACILWDNGIFDNSESPREVFGQYHREEIEWEMNELIETEINGAENTKMTDNPEENIKENYLEFPVLCKNFKNNIKLEKGFLFLLNSFNQLVISTKDPSFDPEYKTLKLFLGDWSTYLNLTEEELDGGDLEEEGSIAIEKGKKELKICFNLENLLLVKEKGIVIIGHGFIISKIFISGPKLIKIEPNVIYKYPNIKKNISLIFDSEPGNFSENIVIKNFYHEYNLTCGLGEPDIFVNQIICEGVFDFSGEFTIEDKNGIPLIQRKLEVIPMLGDRCTIKNLIDTKFTFDDNKNNQYIYLYQDDFTKITNDTILFIEYDSMGFDSYNKQFLKIYEGDYDSEKVLKFKEEYVSNEIDENGLIKIYKGREFIKIRLTNNFKKIKENGITIRGYGLNINSVFYGLEDEYNF